MGPHLHRLLEHCLLEHLNASRGLQPPCWLQYLSGGVMVMGARSLLFVWMRDSTYSILGVREVCRSPTGSRARGVFLGRYSPHGAHSQYL